MLKCDSMDFTELALQVAFGALAPQGESCFAMLI